jgi:hypothetical protein
VAKPAHSGRDCRDVDGHRVLFGAGRESRAQHGRLGCDYAAVVMPKEAPEKPASGSNTARC